MRRILFLISILATALAGSALAQSDGARRDAAEPSWRVLKLDENGRPVVLETGTGEQFTVDRSGLPPVTAPTDEEIDQIDTRRILRGQLLVIDPPPEMRSAILADGYVVLEEMALNTIGISVWRIAIPPGVSEQTAIRTLRDAFPGTVLDTNALLEASAAGVGPDFSRSFIGWGAVPDSCGTGLRIGMLDGAVDTTVPALQGQNIFYEPFTSKNRPPAGSTHGTAIAAMLVGRPSKANPAGGMLPGATLYAASIFETRNGKVVSALSNLLYAGDWLLSRNVSVINMSIAGTSNKVLLRLLNEMAERNVTAVAAAGNFGPNAAPAWPAAHPKVIAVTAIDGNMEVYRLANQGPYVDFAAPGVGLVTEVPGGYKRQSGTSFAAPFLTAMVAMHLKKGFYPDVDALRASLRQHSRDLGEKGKDRVFGWGLVRLKPAC